MVRVAAVTIVIAAIGLAFGGWAFVTSYADTKVGDGWYLLHFGRGQGSITPDEDGGNRRPDRGFGEIVCCRESFHAVWADVAAGTQPPDVDFESRVVLRATVIGSGSCPPHLDGVRILGDAVEVRASIGLARFWGCSGDAVPYTVLLAVERDRLPPLPWELRLFRDEGSWQTTMTEWPRDR